jgi:hypothetical protein
LRRKRAKELKRLRRICPLVASSAPNFNSAIVTERENPVHLPRTWQRLPATERRAQSQSKHKCLSGIPWIAHPFRQAAALKIR